MSGRKVVLDTNVIIFASKQQVDVKALLGRYDDFYTSIVSYMEVYGYQFERQEEKQLIDELFESLEIIEVTQSIADQVVIYRQQVSKKIKLPDAIILATARYLDAELMTDDWDDFQGIDKQVTVCSIDDLKI
jgi:predicted nucleic acid-binding protein